MNKYKIKIELLNTIIKDTKFEMKGRADTPEDEALKGAGRYVIKTLQCWKDILKDEKDTNGWREDSPDIKDSINEVIKHLQEGYISDEHRHSELNWACVECQARILEGGLEMLKDQLDDDDEEDDSNDDVNHR